MPSEWFILNPYIGKTTFVELSFPIFIIHRYFKFVNVLYKKIFEINLNLRFIFNKGKNYE